MPHMPRLCGLSEGVVSCTRRGSLWGTILEISTTATLVLSAESFWDDVVGTSAAAVAAGFSGSTRSGAFGARNIPASVKVQLSAQLIPDEPCRRKEIPLVNMAILKISVLRMWLVSDEEVLAMLACSQPPLIPESFQFAASTNLELQRSSWMQFS